MVSYRRALRPVWIAAVAGAAVVAVTFVAVGAPAKPYPGGQYLTIYDPVTENWGAVAPDITPIGLPRLLLPPTQQWAGIRASRIAGQPPCAYPRDAGQRVTYLDEAITEFRVCGAFDRQIATSTSVTIDNRYGAADFETLARAMAKRDQFQKDMCPAMAILGPLVYAHTESGWWLVKQPIQGCWPDYKLLINILAAHQPTD